MGTGQPLAGHCGIRILVADDQRINRLILESFLRKEGHVVIVAANGAEAVERHRTEHPDLVLMDIDMPVMDGMEAARRIAAASAEEHTPLIFLTAVTDHRTMIDGLGLGDDFIQKPIDVAILRAKLRAFIRLVQAQRQLRAQSQRIEQINDGMLREGQIAAHVLGRVLAHTEPPDGKYLGYRVAPSAIFSGDMVLARRTPGGRLYLLLADAVGHGLPAAINILPLFFPFDGMARKGCSLGAVARELNLRVHDLLPVDRFVAATLVAMDPVSGKFEIWNGGNPPALVLGAGGQVVDSIESGQVALGLNEDNASVFETRHCRLRPGERLLICSDGIWENPAFAGTETAQAIARQIAAKPEGGLDALFDAAVAAGQSDDLSAVLVGPNHAGVGQAQAEPVASRAPAARLSLHFGPESLRRGDPIKAVLDMADSLGLADRFPALPAILRELFSNALDHGVLGLRSAATHEAAAAGAFLAERENRLESLQEGFVTVDIESGVFDGRSALRLTVADSGAGFDCSGMAKDAGECLDSIAGRGLQRVRRLALNLAFNRQGSEVIATIAPQDPGSPPWQSP